jgi:multiple RNA-binding domain-containing protein 1
VTSPPSIGCPVPVATSRLIVKNLPKYMSEKRLREHFAAVAPVTDAQLARADDGRSRQFAFVGFKCVDDARRALKHFHRSFIDTSRIAVDFAQSQADAALSVRPWSKHSLGSSAHARRAARASSSAATTSSTKTATSTTTTTTAAADVSAVVGDDVFVDRRRQDELQAFMVASTAKKRKAWENDLLLPSAETARLERLQTKHANIELQRQASRDAKRARSSADASTATAHRSSATARRDRSPSRSRSRSPSRSRSRSPLPPPRVDDAVVHNSAVSDLDYLKSRMADNVDDDAESSSSSSSSVASSSSSSSASSSSSSSTRPLGNDADVDADANNARLFVRNLPFSIKENELIDYFERFGALDDVHIPIDRETREARGFAYVTFVNTLSAAQAQYECDGRIFQGRVLHVTPAAVDKKAAAAAAAGAPAAPGSYGKRKLEQLKADKSNAAVWASLFTRADAVASATADRLSVSKADLFAGSAGDAAVRLALGETHTIAETLAYFKEHGVQVTAPPGECVRSKTTLIVKNLPYRCDVEQLRRMFARFGDIVQFLSPPSHTIALVQFAEVNFAKAAFKALAYAPFGDVPLFLEWAPEGLVPAATPPVVAAAAPPPPSPPQPPTAEPALTAEPAPTRSAIAADLAYAAAALDEPVQIVAPKVAAAAPVAAEPAPVKASTTRAHVSAPDDEDVAVEAAMAATQERTLFVRNLNFSTTEESLMAMLVKKLGKDAVLAPKIARNATNPKQSAGYGFVECRTRDIALKAYRLLQNVALDGYALEFQLSKSKTPAAAAAAAAASGNKKKRISDVDVKLQSEKLAVKNIAFEATFAEVKQLFSAFGEIKKLRMPVKQDRTSRGFAFVTYATKKEAQQAADTLKHTHFYGRHLVIEQAKE